MPLPTPKQRLDNPERRMTEAQWTFADGLVTDLTRYVELLTAAQLSDPFQQIMRSWALYLLTMAWEMFGSVLTLVRDNKRRAAYSLSRPLIEYYVRFRYYALNAERRAQAWRKMENHLSVPSGVEQTKAWKERRVGF